MAGFIDSFRRYCGSRVLAWLILTNVAIFLGVTIITLVGELLDVPGNLTIRWLCVSSIPSQAITHPWTLLSYMVTQYDFLHLLFNVLWLFWFGTLLPVWMSETARFWLYAGGGVFGALCYVAVSALWPTLTPPGSYLCGASAAVLSIMAAAAICSPDHPVRLLLIGSVKLKWVSLACIALTFVGLGGGNAGAQSAHVGGVLFGAALTLSPALRGLSSRSSKPSAAREFTRKATATARRTVHLNVKRNSEAVTNAVQGRLSDTNRLDELLDKIRLSGYSSLTTGERNELNALSQRLKR